MQNDITPKREQVISGTDNVAVVKEFHSIEGGRALDWNGFPDGTVLKALHVIIKNADGNYAPMPVTAGETPAYGELPTGASYKGLLKHTLTKGDPHGAAILDDAIVNESLTPYDMTAIADDFKAACPHIRFQKDEEA